VRARPRARLRAGQSPLPGLVLSPAPGTGEPVVRARGLVKRFAGRAVLAGVDLDVQAGETVVLLGRSGTGKSVFLKHVIGLVRADEGSLALFGEDVTAFDEAAWNRIRRHVAMVFQGAALFDSMTVADNIALGLRHRRTMPESEVQATVERSLAGVGLSGTAGLKPASLSGGMRKRVGIARAVALAPRLLLYDEPTSGLDPVTSDVINRLIRRSQKELGAAAIVVTHDLASARFIGDRIALLNQGRIIFDGTPADIDRATDPVVRQFVEGRSDETVGSV
jgi:phospholipid/cholesterol/gamma-HCH transport system ATP-binding protein